MDANLNHYGQQTQYGYPPFRDRSRRNRIRSDGGPPVEPIPFPEVIAAEGAKDTESFNASTSQEQQNTDISETCQDDTKMSGVETQRNEESTPLVFSTQDVSIEQYYAKEVFDKTNINKSEAYKRYYGSMDINNHALEFPQPPNACLIVNNELSEELWYEYFEQWRIFNGKVVDYLFLRKNSATAIASEYPSLWDSHYHILRYRCWIGKDIDVLERLTEAYKDHLRCLCHNLVHCDR